jgi:hypothetical protein
MVAVAAITVVAAVTVAAVAAVAAVVLSRRLKKWPQPCWPQLAPRYTRGIRKVYTMGITQAGRVAYGHGVYECQIDSLRIGGSGNQDMHTCPANKLNK